MAISAVFVFFVGFRYFAKPSLSDICDIERLPDGYWLIPTPLPTDKGQPVRTIKREGDKSCNREFCVCLH